MPRHLLLPELAESVVEGEIIKWLVAEGEYVAEDQPVVEVMTDKVTVELPSPYAGVLQKQLVPEGAVVKVHEPIAVFADSDTSAADQATPVAASVQAGEEATAFAGSIVEGPGAGVEDDGEGLSLFKPGDARGEEPLITVRRPAGAGAGAAGARTAPAAGVPAGARGAFGRVLAVPAARRLARELQVAIDDVVGSGPNGRVRVEDVRKHAENGVQVGQQRHQAKPYVTPTGYADLEQRVPVRGLRRIIASQMVASHLQTVRTLHVDEADVSRLVDLRERLKPLAARRGVKLSYLPFVLKAVAIALAEYPELNASLDEVSNEIVLKRYYNIGMAVATDAGLVVPVIRAVDQLTLRELADEVQRLAEAARTGTLAPDDVKGGTFSITNIGSLGGLFSFPIINVPEAAILGVHSIKKRPVVLPDDSIVPRSMLYLSLSFDHRLVDGAQGAGFTGRVIELLETPEALFIDL